ncbi:transcriptional regulator [Streptomyces sp. WAC05374]|uniref:transcriptional regulator n=1 Tax=Streptomyces sp. WAC05374 TaxID=2487420 RepID=UPI00163CA73D|nr:helix-turn-helix transcriptional regulator [Streptomyces sp. WAC05374]
MSAQDDGGGDGVDAVAEFAALLRALKERTDRSYGSLARRLGMNTSTLHRYCAGDAVPLDFAPVERFAALCGATSEQRLELHRRWLLAVAARRRPRTAGTVGAAGAAESSPGAGAAEAVTPGTALEGSTEPDTAPQAEAGPVVETGPAPLPPGASVPALPRRPWYRRRRLVVGLASVCAVLATLGALSALPDGRRASAGGPARVAGPTASGTTASGTTASGTTASGTTASGTAGAGAPERRGASPSPSGTPTSERPSGSATPEEKPGASRPPGATSAPPGGEQPAGLPLAWSVDSQAWKLGCGHDYVVSKPPSQVPPPPAPQDAAPWAATQGAVHGGETLVRLSVQGRSDTAVVLEALRVRVVGRTAPAEGNAYAMDQGCGGAVTPRYFAVDLDKDRPIARAVAGNDSGTPIPAVRMPYRVSAKDPEVLLVTAGTSACDCRWYLELDWSSQGRRGTVRIDDDGRPFRTSAIEGLPRYTYDTLARRWGPYN